MAADDVAIKRTTKGRVGDPFSSPWRRRLPLLPALLFTVAVTQLPFLVSIYYSFTNLKDRTQSLIPRSEEHTSELQSLRHLVCRLLLEKKKPQTNTPAAWTRPDEHRE